MTLHMDNIETLLVGSIRSDVAQFCEWWAIMRATNPETFPAELDSDQWIEQFWAWMEGN